MDGGDCRKPKSPLAVATFIAPCQVRNATASVDLSEPRIKNTNLNGLTPYILHRVPYIRQGKWYTSPLWMTITSSENTGEVIVWKMDSMVVRKSAGGFW